MGHGERGGRGGQRGDREVMQGLVGLREDLGFSPSEVGALEGFGQRRVGPGSGAHGYPLVAAAGRTDRGQEQGDRGNGDCPGSG